MDELAKNRFRNNISAGTYLLLGLMGIFFVINGLTVSNFNMFLMLIVQALIATGGIILLVLRKRDLTAFCFLMFALLFSYYTFTGGVLVSIIVPILLFLFILFALFLLGTNEPKKTSYFCVFLPYGIGAIGIAIFGNLTVLSVIFHLIFALLALFFALVFASEKIKIPLSKKLKADETVEFGRIGPALGYYLFAVPCVISVVSLIIGMVSKGIFSSILFGCGVVLIIAGVINGIFSQQKFASIMFIVMGVSVLFIPLCGEVFYYVAGGMFIFLFILSLLQKESGILLGLMLLFGGAFFLVMGFGLSLAIFGIILAGLAGLLALYIAFALMFEKKSLPLF